MEQLAAATAAPSPTGAAQRPPQRPAQRPPQRVARGGAMRAQPPARGGAVRAQPPAAPRGGPGALTRRDRPFRRCIMSAFRCSVLAFVGR